MLRSVGQVPSNLMLVRVGPRNWLALIAILWGFVCASMAAVTDVQSFYYARFLLGVCEAGFYPGVSFYLRGFFPPEHFGYAYSQVLTCGALAMIVGGPFIAGASMVIGPSGMAGLKPYQWIFVIQGIPSMVVGACLTCLLPATPQAFVFKGPNSGVAKTYYLRRLASSLNSGAGDSRRGRARSPSEDEEKAAPKGEHKGESKAGCGTICRLCGTSKLWALAITFLMINIGFWGMLFWIPKVVGMILSSGASSADASEAVFEVGANATAIADANFTDVAEQVASLRLVPLNSTKVGLLDHLVAGLPSVTAKRSPKSMLANLVSAIPYTGGFLGTLIFGWHSDKTRERFWHAAAAIAIGAGGLIATGLCLAMPKTAVATLTLAAFGFFGIGG